MYWITFCSGEEVLSRWSSTLFLRPLLLQLLTTSATMRSAISRFQDTYFSTMGSSAALPICIGILMIWPTIPVSFL